MPETSADRTERKRRDTTELLLGAGAVLLFAIALVMWPKLGYFIHDVMISVRDLGGGWRP